MSKSRSVSRGKSYSKSESKSRARSYSSASKDNLTTIDRAAERFSGPGKRMNDGWDNWSDRERDTQN